jgi:hypothetical protein
MRWFVLLLPIVACTRTGDLGTDTSGTDSNTETDSTADTDLTTDTDGFDTDGVDTDGTDTGGPCDFAVPSTALVVAEDTSIVEDDLVAWVCRNTTLSYAGTRGTFYLGQRAEIVLAMIGGNTVYAETGADLHNFGTNTLIVGDAADVVDEAEGGATITVCPNLALDLANAPDPGC